MPIPPGHGGLNDRLARIERRLDELARRPLRMPTCVAALNTGGFSAVNNTDVWALGNWHAAYDPEDMFLPGDVGGPGMATIRIPASGLYSVHFHVSWGVNGSGLRACKVTVNGTNIVTDSDVVASDLKATTNSGEGAILDAYSDDQVYDVGDLLTWSVWQNSGASVPVNARLYSGRTAVTVHYLGSA